jgi:hypothetical protein
MADYYPLLERAVSSLTDSTPETRRAIYERARKALLNQLRNVQPPVPESYINRENQALNLSIAQLEAALQRADGSPAASASGRPLVPGPTRPLSPTGAARPGAAAQPPRGAAQSAAARPELRPELKSGADLPPNSSAPPVRGDLRDGDGAPKPDDQPPRSAPDRAEQEVVLDPDDERREGRRPVAIAPPKSPPHPMKRIAILGVILIAATAAVATLAIRLKDNPQDYARARTPVSTEEVEAPSGKLIDRVGSDQTGRAGAPKPSPAPATAPTPPTSAPEVVIPIAQRAAILIEAPDDPQKVKTFIGTSLWRLDTSGEQAVLVAEIALPDAKLTVSMRMARNTDPKLPASHTMEFRFTPAPGSDAPGVSEIDTPQMRIEDSANGAPLAGVPAPIMPNYFLVGLSNGEKLVSRNMELMRDRGWVDIPMVLSNGRIAKLTFEKGASGDRALAQAMQAWDKP